MQIYYGETDCLTFAKRTLHGTERNSEVSQSTQADNRSWTNSTQPAPLIDGNNKVVLSGLKPGDRVVILGNEGLRPGQRLNIIEQPGAPANGRSGG